MRCHLCGLRFEPETDDAEVRCPRCEAKLVNKSKSSSGGEKKEERPQVGCPGCLKVYRAAQDFPFKCRYCAAEIQEKHTELAEFLDGYEEKALERLLTGTQATEIVEELAGQEVEKDRAYNYIDRLLGELPFARHQRWKDGITPEPPPHCDSCGAGKDLLPYEAHWTLNPEELRYRPEWGGFTGEFGKLSNYDKMALYYICKPCKKAKPASFAGGYPFNSGYQLKRGMKYVKKL